MLLFMSLNTKAYTYFFHVVFLECCQFIDVRPVDLQIKNEARHLSNSILENYLRSRIK